ncbi:hypothetical protein D9756_001042 [Leucocoprinus leucothites]|uniref:DUF6534 domain-containing protein n=1 Tax=Leucocoprinus leucothites TaxID=201217 RepID=A0A8H5GFR2_9AGAR|nr:hypothetical protein D9756_001042 [Leucoagaricus leucothites]
MADQNAPPGLPPDIGSLTGPPNTYFDKSDDQFLGIFLNGYLFGILTLQYYNYCSQFRNDTTWLRNLVHVQFFLETAQTAMSVADGFHWFVYGYGNLNKSVLLEDISLKSLESVTFVIALTACCQAVGGFGIGIVNQKLGNIGNWEDRYNVFMIFWSVCSAITDTIIAAIMVYLLLSSTPFNSSRRRTPVMRKLIRLVIETNLASALVAIAVFLTTVISPIAPPKTSYFLCPGYVLGKFNSFITMLNNRRRDGGFGGADESTFSNQNPGENCSLDRRHHHWNSAASRQFKHSASVAGIAVAIHTETDVRLDDASIPYEISYPTAK